MPPQLYALSALVMLALMQSARHPTGAVAAQGTVDPDVCAETFGSESLPVLVPANLHVTLASVTDAQPGQVTLMSNANSTRFSVSYAPSQALEMKAIFDGVTGQILVVDRKADQFDIGNCRVENASADMFSSLMAKVDFLGSQFVIPTAGFFNGSGVKINYEGYQFLKNMNTVRYRTCHYSASLGMTLEVTWWIAQDNSTFVQMKARYGKTQQGSTKETVFHPSLLRSMPDKQDATNHPFTAPRGVFCKGLISAKQAPGTFSRFSLGADRYMYNLPNVPAQGPDGVRESYDQSINVTMMEGEGIFAAIDKTKYGNGRLAKIHDFTRGISYVKNLRYENCSYERISATDWDIIEQRIKTPDEFYVPSLAELQYKGSGVYRSTYVDIYIGYKDNAIDIGDGKKYPLTMEYYMDIKVRYDGTGNPTFKSVPLAAYGTSTSNYTSLIDMYDFDIGVPKAFDHDISDCFSDLQKLHFELQMPIDSLDPNYIKYLYDYRNEFTYALVKSLSAALNISPLRVIQPLVSVFADPLLMLVEITISDNATVPGYTPKQPEASLAQAVANMTEKIAKGSLAVEVTEGDLLFQVPVTNFTRLDTRFSPPSVRLTGIQTGGVIGIAVGTLLAGAAVAFGIALLASCFRKNSQRQ